MASHEPKHQQTIRRYPEPSEEKVGAIPLGPGSASLSSKAPGNFRRFPADSEEKVGAVPLTR